MKIPLVIYASIFIKIFLYLLSARLSVEPFVHNRWSWILVKNVQVDMVRQTFFKFMDMALNTPKPDIIPINQVEDC